MQLNAVNTNSSAGHSNHSSVGKVTSEGFGEQVSTVLKTIVNSRRDLTKMQPVSLALTKLSHPLYH